MRLLFLGFQLISKMISVILILALCLPLVFIAAKGSQPMQIPQVPKGMTYWEFISDRIEAAKVVQPARCGWGMFLSLTALASIYSVVYTDVALHPHGFLAKVTAPDPDIPKNVQNASWQEVPDVWWTVVERLSWTMLGKSNPGCHFRPVASAN